MIFFYWKTHYFLMIFQLKAQMIANGQDTGDAANLLDEGDEDLLF